MREETRSSLLVLLLMLAIPASGQNFTVSTTVVETTSTEITNFSIVTGSPVDFLFTIHNVGNTNISVFPEITVYDSNNNTVAVLTYNTEINISIGSQEDRALSWNTVSTGNFRAKLVVFYDNNSKTVTTEKIFSIPSSVTGHVSSGTGGGTGSGAISREPSTNVDMWEIHEKNLKEEIPTSYVFSTQELGIYEILVTPSKDLGAISVRVELLKVLSNVGDITYPQCEKCKYINIWFDDVRSEKQDRDAIINFKVDNGWMAGDKIGTIKLLRWDENKWISLETQLKNNDEKYTYYQAKTNTFGAFTICFTSLENSITPVIQITETPIVPPVKQKEVMSSFQWLYVIIPLILLVIILYLFTHRKS
jgi:PGF-pre-PGF domain-containing protein